MGRNKREQQKELRYDIKTRVTEKDFNRLKELLAKSRHRTMSEMLRYIICGKAITIYNKDESLDIIMEELTRLRRELNSIGNNFNQVTRQINSLPSNEGKSFLILQASQSFAETQAQISRLYPLISNLAKKWLQE
ncbi:plasmid mobilization relaxosome protein MobC [Chitinophaga sp. CC14]|uniref:plasmid mobilization protein n=1 Tax=Chitinophaga sp. CC14 TaxID=3029199 RepID=UPI003B7BB599